jgi:hypothetical protein
VRKGQLANYEAYRSMYEGRNAQMFHPTTGIITWMSHPAQPSFVWQLYHYDLEPNASLFAVMHASESVHIQLNEATGEVQVINNLPEPLTNAKAHLAIYNLDGKLAAEHEWPVTAAPSLATTLSPFELPKDISPVHFIQLDLKNGDGKPVSSNFYWQGNPGAPDDLTELNKLPEVTLTAEVASKESPDGKRLLTVIVHNPTASVALMAHLQLRRASGERVLPAYYSDNYISLLPNESRTVTIEADAKAFHGEKALIVFDGWNVSVTPASFAGAAVAPNLEAQPAHSPVTGLPFQTTNLR